MPPRAPSAAIRLRPRTRPVCAGLALAVLLAGLAGPARPRQDGEVTEEMMRRVLPGASTFSAKSGDPPVRRGYRRDPASSETVLVGYVFETPDLPPEEAGYSGPVEVLVGMDADGTVTGIEVLRYVESYKSIRGDFINSEDFPMQFAGKDIGEEFRVGRDVDAISRATITSWAVARGVREAARRAARAYLPDADYVAATRAGAPALRAFERWSWEEMRERGLVAEGDIAQPDGTTLRLALAFMGHEGLGGILVGEEDYELADREASRRSPAGGPLLLVGIDGDSSRPFRPERLALRQDGRVWPTARDRFVYAGGADAGKIAHRVRFAGALLLPPELDLAAPFAVLYDVGGAPDGTAAPQAIDYRTPPLALALARGGPIPPELLPAPDPGPPYRESPGGAAGLLQDAPWSEVAAMLGLLALATAAFLRKSAALRWTASAVTLVWLGWVDGSFVSVSHITNGIRLGPSLFLNDLPLLLIILFTAATTLLWGRVLCSSLCPFGALQDFIARLAPGSWRIRPPQAAHDAALYFKYGVLALLAALALLGSELSLFQYFEPFGTAFYFSRSAALWAILAAVLVGAALIPRFYCRYACPLGAALGLVSLAAPWRIRRVPQCDVCKVCEGACPVGAIRGPAIDFKECVRCDVCERKLIARSGACRHSMDEVRRRMGASPAVG